MYLKYLYVRRFGNFQYGPYATKYLCPLIKYKVYNRSVDSIKCL